MRTRRRYIDPDEVGGHAWVFAEGRRASQPTWINRGMRMPADACSRAIEELRSLLRDRHVALSVGNEAATASLDEVLDTHRQAVDAGPRVVAADEVFEAVARDLRATLVDGHLHCVFARPSRDHVADEEPALTVRSAGDDTVVVTIRRMHGSSEDITALRAFADGDLPNARRIVFDLRECPGGDDSHIERWIARRIAASVPLGVQERRTGPARAIDDWNFAQEFERWTGALVHPTWLHELRVGEHIVAALQRLQHVPSGTVREPLMLTPVDAGVEFDAQVLVIVDAGTGSSGESTAIMLREALGARVIGQRTRGCIDYGNTVHYPLRTVDIGWQLSTHRNEFPGVPVDAAGMPVDAELDALDMHASAERILSLIDVT